MLLTSSSSSSPTQGSSKASKKPRAQHPADALRREAILRSRDARGAQSLSNGSMDTSHPVNAASTTNLTPPMNVSAPSTMAAPTPTAVASMNVVSPTDPNPPVNPAQTNRRSPRSCPYYRVVDGQIVLNIPRDTKLMPDAQTARILHGIRTGSQGSYGSGQQSANVVPGVQSAPDHVQSSSHAPQTQRSPSGPPLGMARNLQEVAARSRLGGSFNGLVPVPSVVCDDQEFPLPIFSNGVPNPYISSATGRVTTNDHYKWHATYHQSSVVHTDMTPDEERSDFGLQFHTPCPLPRSRSEILRVLAIGPYFGNCLPTVSVRDLASFHGHGNGRSEETTYIINEIQSTLRAYYGRLGLDWYPYYLRAAADANLPIYDPKYDFDREFPHGGADYVVYKNQMFFNEVNKVYVEHEQLRQGTAVDWEGTIVETLNRLKYKSGADPRQISFQAHLPRGGHTQTQDFEQNGILAWHDWSNGAVLDNTPAPDSVRQPSSSVQAISSTGTSVDAPIVIADYNQSSSPAAEERNQTPVIDDLQVANEATDSSLHATERAVLEQIGTSDENIDPQLLTESSTHSGYQQAVQTGYERDAGERSSSPLTANGQTHAQIQSPVVIDQRHIGQSSSADDLDFAGFDEDADGEPDVDFVQQSFQDAGGRAGQANDMSSTANAQGIASGVADVADVPTSSEREGSGRNEGEDDGFFEEFMRITDEWRDDELEKTLQEWQ